MSAPRTYLFAGGGTGGHIYPGLAIVERLREIEPDARAVFLVSDREVDARILSAVGEAFVVIPARPIVFRPRGMLRFIGSWGGAVRAARAEIARARSGEGDAPREVVMVAMGGFVAAPCAQAARAERVPLALVNLDAAPGKANRWIARFAGMVLTGTQVEGEVARGWTRVGPIVRRAAIAPGDARACRSGFGLDPDRLTLLVAGGSQGAGSINAFVRAWVDSQDCPLRAGGWQVVHQAGRDDGEIDTLRAAYERAGVAAHVTAFLDPMGPAWGAADLAISRAGAGSVAEAWANRVPTLFLPYPYHRDQHQRVNARALESCGGAVVETDRIDATENVRHIGETLLRLVRDASARESMRRALETLGPADGAGEAAKRLQPWRSP
ncbi:MAG: UDP-N-acetylglucosamine--N-acetylmuramyl-(pentapeptide) pyrophosphoryl-undecaprenol N-acetylglucosamine transferase [Phycisphaerales bacterium]|nr:UDP-N-acetylglucosamine--N-acetylmuramyl-(pentapeptide) pyrophosphoryl-undecaprenol N-acetylglucosamine transferase [Phycisphaerales bacterium]